MIRRFLRFVGYLIKIIWPFVFATIRLAFSTMLLALVSTFMSLPRACSLIATDMVKKAIDKGFPSRHEDKLYKVCFLIALFEYILGWVILSYITVWIVGWIF